MRIGKELHEACAVFGVSTLGDEGAGMVYNGLLSLQHRGQEGAGIAVVMDNNNILCYKNTGLVTEVFSRSVLEKLPKGKIAIGHTRYSTTGGNTFENTGPFITEYLTGRIAVSHNGNVTNAHSIRQKLRGYGLHFNATSDSEVVSSLIAYFVTREQDILKGIIKAGQTLQGAFSLVIASSENKLIALRDPGGYRPLCIGKSNSGIAVSSESCALETGGFGFIRNVRPGEMVVIENSAITHEEIVPSGKQEHAGLCIFEYVYFARPDSIIDGLSVYEARFKMGAALAREYPVEADVVCGVPDSGLEAAMGYSAESGIPLSPGFVKNRYIGRSFIYPTQDMRDSAVRLKLNPLSTNISGKRIVLVDDSIVRGTTSKRIVRSLKHSGAKEIHMRISSPPFRYTCHYGTDIDSEENLIANKMSLTKICRKLGADSLGFISLDGLMKACDKCMLSFCTACFTDNQVRQTGNMHDMKEK